ncbi:MAG: hypothetical protein ACRER5_04460 [Pseudomonas sp.]
MTSIQQNLFATLSQGKPEIKYVGKTVQTNAEADLWQTVPNNKYALKGEVNYSSVVYNDDPHPYKAKTMDPEHAVPHNFVNREPMFRNPGKVGRSRIGNVLNDIEPSFKKQANIFPEPLPRHLVFHGAPQHKGYVVLPS